MIILLTNRYNYRVDRLWGEDPEPYLSGGVNLLRLAPLADVSEVELPGLVERMAARINAEPRPRSVKLWTATSEDVVARFMIESSTKGLLMRITAFGRWVVAGVVVLAASEGGGAGAMDWSRVYSWGRLPARSGHRGGGDGVVQPEDRDREFDQSRHHDPLE